MKIKYRLIMLAACLMAACAGHGPQRPAEIVSSNHYAVLDREACSGCETCVGRCQTNALARDDDGLAVLNPDRCIGCGLCVITCPSAALSLHTKAPEEQYQLPEDGMDQMMTLAQKRGIL
ncbi:MAG: ATP-binding protein [Desulfosudaceae bacterium]